MSILSNTLRATRAFFCRTCFSRFPASYIRDSVLESSTTHHLETCPLARARVGRGGSNPDWYFHKLLKQFQSIFLPQEASRGVKGEGTHLRVRDEGNALDQHGVKRLHAADLPAEQLHGRAREIAAFLCRSNRAISVV